MRISREHFGHRSGWVGLPHLLDQLAPLLRRDAARLVGRNVDHLHGVALGLHFFVRLLGPPAAHLVGIPPVVAHELEALVGNVLGDRGDKVARGEDLEVAPDLLVHAGAVEDRSGCRSRARLGRPHLSTEKGLRMMY